MNLMPNRSIAKRRGKTRLFSAAVTSSEPVEDLFEYSAPNGNIYILGVAGGYLKYWTGTAWTSLKSGLTQDLRYKFVVHQGYCYVVNGTDANFRLYNTSVYGVGIAPPAAKPTVAEGAATGITGQYKYVYCYKRTSPLLIGNPSPVSDPITVTDHKITVTVVASGDAQVDKIVIYRTYDLSLSGVDPLRYYKVAEISNASGDYTDSTADADLGEEVEFDNTIPPKAKFIVLYKDRIFYANCPDETDGKSLVMYSKQGIGEAVPSTNYEYFDRGDGEEITGLAALPDFLVVFKRNKTFIIAGDFEAKRSVAPTYGIGNVAPWAILQFEDKIIFLSEAGWMALDGSTFYPLSNRINTAIPEGYVRIEEAKNYSAVYYPEREHFQFLANHSSLTKRVFVGHFLAPLLLIDKGLPMAEQKSENIVGWTYHNYPDALTCLASFTDSSGNVKIMAGNTSGYVFQLDNASYDEDGAAADFDIAFAFETGWHTPKKLGDGTPLALIHTARILYVTYTTDSIDEVTVYEDVDFNNSVVEHTLLGGDAAFCGFCYCGSTYCGMEGAQTDRFSMRGTGAWYRFRVMGSNQQEFSLQALTLLTRIEGVR